MRLLQAVQKRLKFIVAGELNSLFMDTRLWQKNPDH